MTSELEDALNPYASQGRHRIQATNYSPPAHSITYHPVVSPPQQYVPHVSELQMAIAEPLPVQQPQPPPPPPPQPPARNPALIIAELCRRVAATQTAQKAEQERRLAWEQEQEAKFSQRQAEMEKTMTEMLNEIKTLRATVVNMSTQPTPVMTGLPTPPQYNMSPALAQQIASSTLPSTPVSPISRASPAMHPMFVQGSSNNPFPSTNQNANDYHSHPSPIQTQSPQFLNTNQDPGHHRPHMSPIQTQSPQLPFESEREPSSPSLSVEPVAPVPRMTPEPSSRFTSPAPSMLAASSSKRTEKRKKKRRKSYSSEDEESSASSSSSMSSPPRKKRTSHHDKKCYTIHHAMRLHILKLMELETDKELPDSHVEGTQLGPADPIRFVWDKTTKQSVHNARMKTRILEDIKENRRLYKSVSTKDFAKKVLDAAFEQVFVTFRQKYKTQRDSTAAQRIKQREDGKARKARHLSRRKIKLNNRAEARNNLPAFEHVTFDGALQLDCMSSEESDNETDPQSSQPVVCLKTRGFAWRSSRLLQFYYILDEKERMDAASRPQRGQGKKERRIGANKEEFILPPQGISTWMISRRWLRESLLSHPELAGVLENLTVDPPGFDWAQFHDLGEETPDEEPPQQYHEQTLVFNTPYNLVSVPPAPQHHYDAGTFMTYSL